MLKELWRLSAVAGWIDLLMPLVENHRQVDALSSAGGRGKQAGATAVGGLLT